MRHYLIKTEMGYILENCVGKLVKWFDMAANSKSYCMDKGIEPIYLSKKSPLNTRAAYTLATGKTLWFDQKGVYHE